MERLREKLMEMRDAIADITKSKGRKHAYHFTRAGNLPAIARYDALFSANKINPGFGGERRSAAMEIYYEGAVMTVNPHLTIAEAMIDAATTLKEFRAGLDSHVFFWPTLADCRKMMDTYARREPEEPFAVLKLDAFSMLLDHAAQVRLSKYDSGSSPRFPHRCSYRKSPDMWLPLRDFKTINRSLVPAKASEIREILVENEVTSLSKYLQAVYVDHGASVPGGWRHLEQPWSQIRS